MRTTVTLDADVERLLKNAAHQRGKSFKVVLNEAVRQSLGPKKKTSTQHPPLPVFSSELRPGLDWGKLSDLADELEDQEIIARMNRLEKRLKAKGHAHS
jgi:hypothetical protein